MKKIKEVFVKLLLVLIKIAIIVFSIGLFFGVIFFFIWSGWKGFAGFTIGVLITGFVFMSEHPFIQVYRELILK